MTRAFATSSAVTGPTPWPSLSAHEIYEHLEKVLDRFEDVANQVNGIVIEHL